MSNLAQQPGVKLAIKLEGCVAWLRNTLEERSTTKHLDLRLTKTQSQEVLSDVPVGRHLRRHKLDHGKRINRQRQWTRKEDSNS